MSVKGTCVLTALLTLVITGVRGWVSDGSDFIVACPSVSTSIPTVDCILHVTGSEGVLVNITGSLAGLPLFETISSALILRVILQGNYANSQAIIVSTSADVSLFVEHNSQAGVGAYLSIPIGTDLNQPYTGGDIENLLVSLPVPNSEKNMYVIASAYENTLITLTIKSTGSFVHDSATYSDGGTLSATLASGGVLEIVTGEDLTGTVVVSSKPVTLFMGTIVEPSFEQIPPVGMWESTTGLIFLDICTESTARFISSVDGALLVQQVSGDESLTMTKGIHQDLPYNETSFARNLKHLVGVSCTVGNKRIALFNFPASGIGYEFKCLALNGYNNSAFVLNLKTVSVSYDVSGVAVLFTVVDSYTGAAIFSTMRGPVGEGYVIMNALDTALPDRYSPAIVGFSANGAYALTCAKGGLGSLLPDPLHSLVDVYLAVFSPSPTAPSSTMDILSSSDVIIEFSSPLDIFSSSDVNIEFSSPSDMFSSSDVNIEFSSPSDIFSSSDVNIKFSSPSDIFSSSDVIFSSSSDVNFGSTSDVGIDSSTDVSLTSFVMSSSNDPTSIVASSVLHTESSSALMTLTPTTETGLDVTEPSTEEVCFCRCGENEMLPEETQAFLEEYDIEIKKNLTLDSKTLSSYIRTKTSADDPRPSAHNVGYFGVVMLCVPFAFLIFSDLLNIFQMTSSKQKRS